MAAQLAQGLAGIDAAQDRIQRHQALHGLAPLVAGRALGRQQVALARPAEHPEQICKTGAPGRGQQAARRVAGGIEQGRQMRQQSRCLDTCRGIGGQPRCRTLQSIEAGFGRQQFAQPGFDPGAGIGFIDIGRPADATQQGAQPGLGHAPRMDKELQQAQGNIDQRLTRQRRPGNESVLARLRRPAGTYCIRVKLIVERGLQQMPSRRQIGNGDAQA